MSLVVDTGVFSASLSRRRRARLESHVRLMVGHQIFLAAITVSELRYGALVAQWGEPRRERLETSIEATTVVPVSDGLLSAVAELRYECRLTVTRLMTAATPAICGSPHRQSTSAHHSSPPTTSSRTPQA